MKQHLPPDALIIDPGFANISGHHANLNRFFHVTLKTKGFEPLILRWARRHPSFDNEPDIGLGVFAMSPYTRKINNHAELKTWNNKFHADFCKTLSRERPRVMVAHTLRHTFAEGFCRFLADTYGNEPIKLILGVVETTALSTGDELHEAIAKEYRVAFNHLKNMRNAQILLLAETQELGDYLQAHSEGAFPILEAPYLGANLVQNQSANRSTKDRPLTIGYLGQSRLERGIDLLPQIAEHVMAESGRPVRWLLQFNPDTIRARAGAGKAKEFRILGREDYVQVLEPFLPVNDYHAALDQIDIMLMPYNSRYDYSGSGVALESLRCGHVQVVPAKSSMATVARANGAIPVTFKKSNAQQVAAAVIEALNDFENLSASNRRAATRLIEQDEILAQINRFLD